MPVGVSAPRATTTGCSPSVRRTGTEPAPGCDRAGQLDELVDVLDDEAPPLDDDVLDEPDGELPDELDEPAEGVALLAALLLAAPLLAAVTVLAASFLSVAFEALAAARESVR